MNDSTNYFITWTTYGNWLPGDGRKWRKWKMGEQPPQPLLRQWCENRMNEPPVLLNSNQRIAVESVCRKHAEIRGWELHAVNARSNHVQLLVTADADGKIVRGQFKANATNILRQHPNPIANKKVWTRGGDIEIVDGDDAMDRVVLYITVAQDRMDRGK